MASNTDLDEIVQYDQDRRSLQQYWRDNPPPTGFYRHEGYYGCGRLTHDSGGPIECGCGMTILRCEEKAKRAEEERKKNEN